MRLVQFNNELISRISLVCAYTEIRVEISRIAAEGLGETDHANIYLDNKRKN